MNNLITYFFEEKKQLKEVTWFRTALYLFLLYKAIVYTYFFNELFSAHTLIYHHIQFLGFLQNFVYCLNNFYSEKLAALCIACLALLSLYGLFGKSNYFSNLLLWIIIINISFFLYPTLTGGDYLLNQLLLFNIFLSTKKTGNSFEVLLHNTGLLAFKIQICLAYFMAGLYKLLDPSWFSGVAIYNTIQIPEYSSAILMAIPYFVLLIINYLTIIYQFFFPLIVWWPKTKIYVLGFGFMQHLFIAFAMGLFSFGVLMIICYILFLKYDNKF